MIIEKHQDINNIYQPLRLLPEDKNLSFKQKKCLNNIYKGLRNNHLTDKKKLRKIIKLKRNKINTRIIEFKSIKICNKVLNSIEYKNSSVIFCYIPFNNEVNTQIILDNALKNKKLTVPVIKNNKMYVALIDNLENLIKNKYGIYQPVKYKEISKKEVDFALVPALVYNSLGFRLGYGGGYYDRFLEDYTGISIGLIFKKFVNNKFIPEEYDRPVDKIITE